MIRSKAAKPLHGFIVTLFRLKATLSVMFHDIFNLFHKTVETVLFILLSVIAHILTPPLFEKMTIIEQSEVLSIPHFRLISTLARSLAAFFNVSVKWIKLFIYDSFFILTI